MNISLRVVLVVGTYCCMPMLCAGDESAVRIAEPAVELIASGLGIQKSAAQVVEPPVVAAASSGCCVSWHCGGGGRSSHHHHHSSNNNNNNDSCCTPCISDCCMLPKLCAIKSFAVVKGCGAACIKPPQQCCGWTGRTAAKYGMGCLDCTRGACSATGQCVGGCVGDSMNWCIQDGWRAPGCIVGVACLIPPCTKIGVAILKAVWSKDNE